MGIEEVAAELYSLAPEEFTAARNARVKQAKADGETDLAGDIQGLRKPTVGAWLLNQLVRRNRALVDQLFDLGEQLRAAQGTLGAAELRALGEQRRQLTRAVAEQAAGIGREDGRKVSAQVVAAVEETLRSAMVDPQAGAALATGLLIDTFSSTGLEPVDIAAVVAISGNLDASVRQAAEGASSAEAAATTRRDERAVAEAREALKEAEEAATAAAAEAEAVRQSAVAAARRRTDLDAELAQLRRQVKELQRRLDDAEEAEDECRRKQIAATRAEQSAIDAADRAQRRLDRLLADR